ncbi:probable ribosomal protein S11, mitochondrial isoform X1 [Malus sylvestris]|uniref:probable ribosomal protein S11, mitochondrial isoform X1 n=2 Tax=Malus sylvestris TaxID=3752 RepID=UPI0021ABC80C|nr:probable ribosomal protein S11, mitochondrial isoform X1 [Malus sylvestris]
MNIDDGLIGLLACIDSALRVREIIHAMCSSLSRLSSSLIHRLARTRCQGQAELITSRSFSVSTRSINFVRGVIEEDGRNNLGGSQFPRYNIEQNADIVHVKLMKNNTFVTVTDSKGNKKLGASAGSLPDMKGGPKLAKYSAEATAEHVGRMSRNFGLKSVVMKVKGFTYFKKKRQAIISWKEGFTSSRAGHSPIVYIEDRTRKPHNGCRLPKQCRI